METFRVRADPETEEPDTRRRVFPVLWSRGLGPILVCALPVLRDAAFGLDGRRDFRPSGLPGGPGEPKQTFICAPFPSSLCGRSLSDPPTETSDARRPGRGCGPRVSHQNKHYFCLHRESRRLLFVLYSYQSLSTNPLCFPPIHPSRPVSVRLAHNVVGNDARPFKDCYVPRTFRDSNVVNKTIAPFLSVSVRSSQYLSPHCLPLQAPPPRGDFGHGSGVERGRRNVTSRYLSLRVSSIH